MTTTVPKSEAPKAPAYKRIETDLRMRIGRGDWLPGVMLPGRRDLAKEYGVDLMTLQRAIASLLDDNTLVASGRRGTFVNADAVHMTPVTVTTRPVKPLHIGVVGLSVDDYSRMEPMKLFFNHTFLAAFESTLQSERNVDFEFSRLNAPGGPGTVSINEALAVFEDKSLDGIVFVFADLPEDIAQISRLMMTSPMPVVVASSRQIDIPIPSIYYDSFSAGYEAAHQLILAGAKEIVVVAPFEQFWMWERIIGIAKAIEHSGLPESSLTRFPGEDIEPLNGRNQLELGKAAGAALFAERPRTSAVIAINDHVAMGVVSSARKAGRIAGKHYKLISFDDIPQAAMAGISSMRPPLDIMGREAAKMMLQLIDGERDISQMRLKSRLIVRSSMRFEEPAGR